MALIRSSWSGVNAWLEISNVVDGRTITLRFFESPIVVVRLKAHTLDHLVQASVFLQFAPLLLHTLRQLEDQSAAKTSAVKNPRPKGLLLKKALKRVSSIFVINCH